MQTTTQLVLIGGGHAHLEVLRRFAQRPVANVALTLISPQRHMTYSGMLPGLVAGHYAFDNCHIDLHRLAGTAHAHFVMASVCRVDAQNRRLALSDGSTLGFDRLSIDAGATIAGSALPGVAALAIPLKPAEAFLKAWTTLAARAKAGEIRSIVVVGGGAGSVEVTLAMRRRLADVAVRFTLVFDSAEPFAAFPVGVRARVLAALRAHGVALRGGSRVDAVDADTVVTERGERIAADAVIWATGPAADARWGQSGLTVDDAGFILVDRQLRAVTTPAIFAAGDCASVRDHPHPRSGVYAVRHGAVLAANLQAVLRGEPLVRFSPQPYTLALISTGERRAIAAYGGFSLEGAWVWRWKDWIDRRFVARYR